MQEAASLFEPSAAAAARASFERAGGRPWFLADWENALFLHYAFAPADLQPHVPLELDVRDGVAYVSLVAFTQRRLRPALCPPGAWVPRSLAQHVFLNVRTYVRTADDRGIFFLVEWVSSRLACLLGPLLYGLPYRRAAIDYRHDPSTGALAGSVRADHAFSFRAWVSSDASPRPCAPDTLDAFFLERYIAFTQRGGRLRAFRIWHQPWPQVEADGVSIEDELIRRACPWFEAGEYAGAHYSPGVRDVWISRPRGIR